MKKIFFPVLILLALLMTGCPVGLEHSLGNPGSEPLDSRLLGTWVCNASDPEVKKVTIALLNERTLKVTVQERGSMYSLETDELTGCCTKLNGATFVYFQPKGDGKFFHYQYRFEGNSLVTNDVSLLEGGVDAVTSTEALRTQVTASMRNSEWAKESLTWTKVE